MNSSGSAPGDPSPDEAENFSAAMNGVRPIRRSDRLPPHRPAPPPQARSREADERAVLEELRNAPLDFDVMESGDVAEYRAPGVQDSVWRHLRRGGYRIGAELDLHGCNREQAHLALVRFILDCRDTDRRCVRIIHGKGLRSPNTGPVLKSLLNSWLRRRADVLAFCPARAHDGGSGAMYLLLRGVGRGL
jgi:DNA-nicking Smr family endonuclease